MNIKESILVAVQRTVGSRFFDYVLRRCDADLEVRRPPSPIRYPFAQKASPFTTFPPSVAPCCSFRCHSQLS